MIWKSVKPLLKGCIAMSGPKDNPKCTRCPGRCSYRKHLNIFEKTEKIKDVDAYRSM